MTTSYDTKYKLVSTEFLVRFSEGIRFCKNQEILDTYNWLTGEHLDTEDTVAIYDAWRLARTIIKQQHPWLQRTDLRLHTLPEGVFANLKEKIHTP